MACVQKISGMQDEPGQGAPHFANLPRLGKGLRLLLQLNALLTCAQGKKIHINYTRLCYAIALATSGCFTEPILAFAKWRLARQVRNLLAVWVDADNPCHHAGEQTSHQHDGGHDGVHLDGEEYGESRPSSSSHCACL